MIELQNIKALTVDQIVDLLLEEKVQSFEIYIPKSTQLYFSEHSAVAADYAYLAFAGHLLNQVADSFEYEEVSSQNHDSVLFKITTTDLNALAEQLLFISYYDINDHEDEEFVFWEEIELYLEEIKKNKIQIACPYFYQTYQSISSNIESEE